MSGASIRRDEVECPRLDPAWHVLGSLMLLSQSSLDGGGLNGRESSGLRLVVHMGQNLRRGQVAGCRMGADVYE